MNRDPSKQHPSASIRRDAALLDAFARQYRPALTRFFRKRTPEFFDVDDLVQDVFTRLAVRGDGRSIQKPEAFLLRTASNVWRDFLRKRQTHQYKAHDEYCDEHHGPMETCPDQALQGSQTIEILINALNELPKRTYLVFVLCRIEGLSQRDAAKRLGVSVSSIEKHMMKAIAHLAFHLGDEP